MTRPRVNCTDSSAYADTANAAVAATTARNALPGTSRSYVTATADRQGCLNWRDRIAVALTPRRGELMARWFTVALAAAIACAVFATFGAASVNVAQSGWSWGSPTPQGNTLNSIDFVQGRGYAAGDAGTVLRTDDGGINWTGLATGTSADLTRLQVLDPDTLMVLGGDGCVLRRSDDAGATFRKVFIIVEQNCAGQIDAFTFVDRQTGYLLIRGGNVYRTSDGGQTFSRQTAIPGTDSSNNPSGNRAVDIAFTSADTGIVFVQPPGGGPAIAFSTTDAGNSWKPVDGVDPGTVRRVWFFDAQHG